MSSSIRDLGRHHDGDGGPLLIRCAYPPSRVAILVTTASAQRIFLADHVAPCNVARVLRHLSEVHAPSIGADACYAPACAMAATLRPTLGVDLTPAIASSA